MAQVVMITGAAGTLGKAVAAAFAAQGARRVLLDVSIDALRAAHREDEAQLLLPVDLLDLAQTQRVAQAAIDRFGRIDALCNIAGGFSMGPKVHETTDQLWRSMLDINAGTLLNAVRAVVPHMLAVRRGRIVNVGSTAALSGKPGMGAYVAAKSAVIRLTESLSAELRDQGINVNCVLPSIIDTPPNRAAMPEADPARWVAPADLAAVITFLSSDDARAIHGAALPVAGLS